jgi:3-methyladenine DNA glycosylase Tag
MPAEQRIRPRPRCGWVTDAPLYVRYHDTICYAFMQACGLVDDHVQGCFRAARR